jgi:hypothetical protein
MQTWTQTQTHRTRDQTTSQEGSASSAMSCLMSQIKTIGCTNSLLGMWTLYGLQVRKMLTSRLLHRSWRRIVMNLFGNALKYTETGYISVSLRVNEGSIAAGVPETVTLTITDSGQGMSADFLANKAFQAFSQENPVCASRVRLRLVKRLTRSSECSTPRGRD